jgi:methionyl-tRNA formyltransferase
MRVVFFGTPDFAVPHLDAVVHAGHDVVLVVSRPDAPVGRGQQMASPPVVVRARELGLDVAQPKALKSGPFPERFAAAKADVAVVVAYGRILTPHYLGGPRYGCVNVHGSLLPRWRGAAPIQAAILAGDATSGVSTQRMVERLDAGDVYLSREIPLDPRETGGSLHDRLMALGAEVLVDTLAKLPDLRPVPQDESLATFCRPLTKDDGRVDFGEPAAAIDRRIRAMTPWPGGWVPWDGGPLKLLDVAPVDGAGPPGVVLSVDPLVIACGEGAVRVDRAQAPGRKPVTGAELARGLRLTIGGLLRAAA